MIEKKLLAKKYTGMMISADGVLGRIVDGQRPNKVQRYLVGEMLNHLQQAADGFYQGNICIVDEFFQLYCLGEKERKKVEE